MSEAVSRVPSVENERATHLNRWATGIAGPQSIEAACQRLSHPLGWRFLTCPCRNLECATVALITDNPGGRIFEECKYSVEGGSAYEIEQWKGFPPGEEILQRQVRRMYSLLDTSAEDVLSGYFVPFRSPGWSDLTNKDASIAFGKSLWATVFEYACPSKVIAFGKGVAGRYLPELLDASVRSRTPAGWGNQTIDTYSFRSNGLLVVLPHLSRYRLFDRPDSEAAFRRAVGIM